MSAEEYQDTEIEQHLGDYLREHDWEGPLGRDLGLQPGQEVWRRPPIFDYETGPRVVTGITAAFHEQAERERREREPVAALPGAPEDGQPEAAEEPADDDEPAG